MQRQSGIILHLHSKMFSGNSIIQNASWALYCKRMNICWMPLLSTIRLIPAPTHNPQKHRRKISLCLLTSLLPNSSDGKRIKTVGLDIRNPYRFNMTMTCSVWRQRDILIIQNTTTKAELTMIFVIIIIIFSDHSHALGMEGFYLSKFWSKPWSCLM